MRTPTYPLAVPEDLLEEVKAAAKQTGLSNSDVMRQSMKLGLSRLVQQLSRDKVQPMTKQEARDAYAPDPEWDALETAMTRRAVHRIPE